MLLDILRDGLDEDELTNSDISRRELALDKCLIQLLQSACKNERYTRALDLAKMLHHTVSFDMAIKVAQFYHLIGLQEKMEALRDDREDGPDRLVEQRQQRRERKGLFAPVPDSKPFAASVEFSRPKAFQDFRPPPTIARPGLERASGSSTSKSVPSSQITGDSQMDDEPSYDFGPSEVEVNDFSQETASPDGKRKRNEDGAENGTKRRAVGESIGDLRTGGAQPRTSYFCLCSTYPLFSDMLPKLIWYRCESLLTETGSGRYSQSFQS